MEHGLSLSDDIPRRSLERYKFTFRAGSTLRRPCMTLRCNHIGSDGQAVIDILTACEQEASPKPFPLSSWFIVNFFLDLICKPTTVIPGFPLKQVTSGATGFFH